MDTLEYWADHKMRADEITDKEQKFLAARAKIIRAGPLVGGMLVCLFVGLGIWLFLYHPLLANPLTVLARLQDESISTATLMLMAALLPFFVLLCLVLMLTIAMLCIATVINEKKYITIIQRLVDTKETPHGSEPDTTGTDKAQRDI